LSSDNPSPKSSIAESLPGLLKQAVADSPESLALKTVDSSVSYRELLEGASDLAENLRSAGAVEGTGVGIWLSNGVDWLVSYWGATLNGNVVVPLSTWATPAEIETLVLQTGIAVVISDEGLRSVNSSKGEVLASEFFTGDKSSPEAVHLIQFTSGSTGEPKGAMLTHQGLISAARHHAEAWRLEPGNSIFVPNPFSHILGLMYGVLTPMVAQGTVLTMPRFGPAQAVELLVRSEAVAMTGAPTHLQLLTEQVEREDLELPHLRLAFTGGAAITPEWVDRVCGALDLEALVNGYGMSEVGSIAQTRIDDPPRQVASSVGFLAPGLEARIVDPESGVDLAVGEVGEFWVRGPSVMKGYYRNGRLTREALVEGGWLRTGDLMRRDAEGRLSFVSRLGDMFTVGGFNVYPAEVERALTSHPEIEQAAVLPVADERLGSVPVAFVCCRAEDVEEAVIQEHCKLTLRNYMVPRCVFLMASMPLNRAGKVDKRQLAQQVEKIDVE
jgi:acyl-CoA synthetase (AMP-forming)/AMP-acid ligase II